MEEYCSLQRGDQEKGTRLIQYLSRREDILRLGIEELLARLKSDQLQPVVVLQAYQAKALAVNEEINAVCDFILEATEQAEALALLPPEERGSLHGLPLSVKV